MRVCQDKDYGTDDFSNRLRQRADHTEKLSFACEELLQVINNIPDARKSPHQLAETGCSHSGLNRMDSGLTFVDTEGQKKQDWSKISPCPGSYAMEEDSESSGDAYEEAVENL
jgi:hypothetical protein